MKSKLSVVEKKDPPPVQWATLDPVRPPKKSLTLGGVGQNLRNQAPLDKDSYEWVSPITGAVFIRKRREPVLTAEEVSAVQRIVSGSRDVAPRPMPIEPVTGGRSLPNDVTQSAVPGQDHGFPPVVAVQHLPVVDDGIAPTFEDVSVPSPTGILVSTVVMPEPATKPDPSLVFSLAGRVGTCSCGKTRDSCVVYVDSRPDRTVSQKGYRMIYGNPFHQCASVNLDGQVTPLKGFIRSVFSGGASLPEACNEFTRMYLRACFHCDWYYDAGMDPPLVQSIVLEESPYLVPGSRKLTFFYDRVKKVFDSLTVPATDDVVWPLVFKDFHQIRYFYADAVLGRSFWPANALCPCPPLPVTPEGLRAEVSSLVEDSIRTSYVYGLVEAPDLVSLGKSSAVLAHLGMWFTVVSPHSSSARYRYLGLAPPSPGPPAPFRSTAHFTMTVRDGPVTVDYVNLGKVEICEKHDLFLRYCPAIVFQGRAISKFVQASPNSDMDVFRPGIAKCRGWKADGTHDYVTYDVALSPHDSEAVSLYVRMVFDLRPFIDVDHWMLVLPWATFGDAYLAAIRFMSGGYHGRLNTHALFCLRNSLGWSVMAKVGPGHIVGLSAPISSPAKSPSGAYSPTVYI